MANELTLTERQNIQIQDAIDRAEAFYRAATAQNTRKAYDVAWRCFTSWCHRNDLSALPADAATVGLYLAALADTHKLSSLRLRLAAITVAHRNAGLTLDTKAPAIAKVMRGIQRTNGSAVTKKQAATAEIVRDAVRAFASGDTNKAKRDKAIMLIGFYAALRRSELSAINVEDINVTPDGLVLTLPRRKTDQAGEGTVIGLPVKADASICPVKAWQAWMAVKGDEHGPAFVSVSRGDRILSTRLGDKDVARIIKAAMAQSGYDASQFSGHSLRSGFVTSAARAGVADRLIMKQTGHKRLDQMHSYIRAAGLFTENAATAV